MYALRLRQGIEHTNVQWDRFVISLGAFQQVGQASARRQDRWRIVAVKRGKSFDTVSRYRLRGFERTACAEAVGEIFPHVDSQGVIGAQVQCEQIESSLKVLDRRLMTS